MTTSLIGFSGCGQPTGRGQGAGGAGGAAGQDGSPANDGPAGAGGAPGGPFGGEYTDPSAPPGPAGSFGGGPSTDPAAAPALVYPLDGAMLGRNIGGMNLQWRAGGGNTIFRVRIKGDRGEARLYAGGAACPDGKCRLLVPDDFWRGIAGPNAGATVHLAVDGVAAPGEKVATSTAIAVSFTPNDLSGGIYYWSTKQQGIMRVALGATAPEPFLGDSGHCVGCHSVTRDGCTIAYTGGGSVPCLSLSSKLGVVEPKDPKTDQVSGAQGATMAAVDAEGKRIVTTIGGEITVRDLHGVELARVKRSLVGPAGHDKATHPEWSPDGQTIVFTRDDGQGNASSYFLDCEMSGDIASMPWKDGAFGDATVLVAATADEFNFYPHVSPDSKWVVFDTAKRPGRSSHGAQASYDQMQARLRLVPLAGGAPVELGNATHAMGRASSWPKFAPFVQESGSLFFVVFSSRLDYGWLLEQDAVTPQPPSPYGRPQLWVAAIDVSRPGDPSSAPFWLPFQLPAEGNHLGYWTTRIVSATVGGTECK